MLKRSVIAIVILASLTGCASAKKSFSQGHEAEVEGRWVQAAEQYIDALRQDPEYPGAHARAPGARPSPRGGDQGPRRKPASGDGGGGGGRTADGARDRG